MASVVAAEPDKAARWRTEELEAAWSYADLAAAVERGMEQEADQSDEVGRAAAAPAGGPVLGSTAPGGEAVDQDEVMG